jgi:hypothetical protein
MSTSSAVEYVAGKREKTNRYHFSLISRKEEICKTSAKMDV